MEPLGANLFTFVNAGGACTLVSEASTLFPGEPGVPREILVRGHRETVRFVASERVIDPENDVMFWEYVPADGRTDVRVQVFND